MKRPIVYLAFSNSSSDDLPYLKEEADSLNKLFRKAQDEGKIDLIFYPNITFDQLAEDLRSLKREVMIFHFGGHGSSNNLELQSSPIYLEHIAKPIAKFWKPVLIFMNGCSTGGVAKVFLKEGVKTIIATEEPVGDELAKDFSINFYSSFLENLSTIDSFELAKSISQADGRKIKFVRNPEMRELNIPITKEKNSGLFPYKYFTNKSARKLKFNRYIRNRLFFKLLLTFIKNLVLGLGFLSLVIFLYWCLKSYSFFPPLK